jgi:hypothetical protein
LLPPIGKKWDIDGPPTDPWNPDLWKDRPEKSGKAAEKPEPTNNSPGQMPIEIINPRHTTPGWRGTVTGP